MFRNVRWYRFEGPWPDSEAALSDALEAAVFAPCGPMTERSNGWEAILPDTSESLARRVNGVDVLRLRSQSRILPAAAVNEELEARIDAFRKRTEEAPSTREKRRLKAEARDELMPKAMLKSDRIWGYVDPKDQVIAIDTAQEANAERFLRRITAAIDGLSIQPLQFREPVETLLGKVMFGDSPRQFNAGRECRMQDLSDSRAIVRWTNFDLTDPSIRNHVAEGMRLTHMAVEYDNVMSAVLSEDGVLSKLKFLGEDDDSELDNDPAARLDAEIVLLSGTLRHLLSDLRKLLGGVA
jgi:recombination associated protein RdgC